MPYARASPGRAASRAPSRDPLPLPHADELVLTEVEREFDGDAFFPPFDRAAFTEVQREHHHAAPPNDFDFSFVTYRRSASARS